MRNAGDEPTFGARPTFGTWPGDTDAREDFEAAVDDPAELQSLIDPDYDQPGDQPSAGGGSEADRDDGRTRPLGGAAANPEPPARSAPSPPRLSGPPRSRRRMIRWPSIAATGLIGLLISGGVASLLDAGDAERPPASAVPASPAPVAPGPVLPAGTEKWVIDAQVALAEVREALAAIEAAEREWNAQPAGRREGALPPPVAELQARKAALRQQEATLVADLAAIAAVHDSARQVRDLEVQLAELERAVPRGPAPPTATAQRVAERERMLREQLQTRREELTRWQSGAYTAITTPLPDPPPVEPIVGAVVDLTRRSEDPTPEDTPESTAGVAPGREPDVEDEAAGDDDEGAGEPPEPEADETEDAEPGVPVVSDLPVASDVLDAPERPDAPDQRDRSDTPDRPDKSAESPASPPTTDAVDPEALYEQLERLDTAVEQLDRELDRTLDELRPYAEQGSDSSGLDHDYEEPSDTTEPDTGTDDNAGENDATNSIDDPSYSEEADAPDAAPETSEQPDAPSSDTLPEVSEQLNESASAVADKIEITGDFNITGHYDSETRAGGVEMSGTLTLTDKTNGATQTLHFTDDDGAGGEQMPQYLPGAIQEALDATSAAQPQPVGYTPGSIQAALAGPA